MDPDPGCEVPKKYNNSQNPIVKKNEKLFTLNFISFLKAITNGIKRISGRLKPIPKTVDKTNLYIFEKTKSPI